MAQKKTTTAKKPAKSTTPRGRLGRGLGALFGSELEESKPKQKAKPRAEVQKTKAVEESPSSVDRVQYVKLSAIIPTDNQPRKSFQEEQLADLAASIERNGILQPILVTQRPDKKTYQIIAGERRWRAARLAKLKTVPVLIREVTESERLEQALIENIQRQDLNPIEEAQALKRLMEEHKLTQEELADRVGKSRPAIANTLRLLQLPDPLQTLVIQEDLTAGHARALLPLSGLPHATDLQLELAARIVEQDWSVRQTEEQVKRLLRPQPEEETSGLPEAHALALREVEKALARLWNTKVQIHDSKNRGRIVIHYHSADEREEFLEKLKK